MRMIHPFAEWLRRHRRIAATAAVLGFLISSSWAALPRHTQQDHTLLCSTRINPSRDRFPARGFFDPHWRVVRVNSFISGALRLASSL